MTETTASPEADPWDPANQRFAWVGAVVFVVWSGVQPVAHGLLQYPAWLAFTFWVVGLIVANVAVYAARYRRAAPYRSILAAARQAHPDSVVYGVRLDPITTPVGKEWADSRALTWGLIIASPQTLDIIKFDGVRMLHQPWSAVKFASQFRTSLFVSVDGGTEEWWIPLISESGAWPMGFGRRPIERRILQMLAVGGEDASDGVLVA